MSLKICTKCNQSQMLSEYPKHKAYKDRLTTWCRSCLRKQADLWAKNNKERSAANSKMWQSRNPRSRANSKLKARYGITIEIYEQMLLQQQNVCAICKKHQSDNLKNKLFVDHCHVTGTVRGLLCHDCNSGLGNFKDNVIFLTKAFDYLKRFEK